MTDVSKTKDEPIYDDKYNCVVIGWDRVTSTSTFIARPTNEIAEEMRRLEEWKQSAPE